MANAVEFQIKFKDLGSDVVKKISANLENADDVVLQLTNHIQSAGSSLKNAANEAFRWNQVRDVLSGVSDMLDQIVAPAQSFEQSMRAANTMAGKSGKDFDSLKESIKGLSMEIPIARDLLAKGLYQVVSNGVPENNWIEYLRQSAKASVGGIADLEKVVTVTSTVIKNYGLSWDQAQVIQDKIQTTAKNGVTSFEQLADALPRVSGNAATLGVQIDELMAVFATLTGVSGNTAEVSTQLAAVFTALVKPTAEASEMAQSMGVQFNAAAVQAAGGLLPFLQTLNARIEEYSAKTGVLTQTIYGNLFGSAESLRALIPLTGELASKFETNVTAMAESTGAIDGAFEQMGSTVQSADAKLKNWAAGFSDMINNIVGSYTPVITFTAQIALAATQLAALYKIIQPFTFKGFIAGLTTSKVALIAKSIAIQTVTVVTNLYKAAMIKLTVTLHSAKAAAVTLTAALTAGLSLAIWGVIEGINYLIGKRNEEQHSSEAAAQAEEEYKETLVSTRAEMQLHIQKLKNFSGSKEEEKRLVGELNTKYGESFGHYKTIADWYDTLIQKSELYCQSLIEEAKQLSLSRKIADLEEKYKAFGDDDGIRKYEETKQQLKTEGFSDDQIEKHGATWIYKPLLFVKSEIENAYKELNESIIKSSSISKKLKTTTVNVTPTQENQSSSDNVVYQPPTDLSQITTYTELNKALDYYEKKMQDATAEGRVQIQTQINALEGLKQAWKDALKQEENPAPIEKLTTLEQLSNAITHYEEKQKKQSGEELLSTQRTIDKLKEKKSQIEQNLSLPQMETEFNQLQGLAAPNLKIKLEAIGIDEIQKRIAMLKAMLAAPNNMLTEADIEKINLMTAAYEGYAVQIKSTTTNTADAQQGLNAISSLMGNIAGVVDDNTAGWLQWGANLLSTIAQALPQLATLFTANAGLAAAEGAKSVAGIPIAGPILAVAAIGSIVAALASIPKFAAGGIAYGPTLGLFGEYAGASNNPEVVAPLNTLRKLIEPRSEMGGVVSFKIEGRTLKGILEKENKYNRRTS